MHVLCLDATSTDLSEQGVALQCPVAQRIRLFPPTWLLEGCLSGWNKFERQGGNTAGRTGWRGWCWCTSRSWEGQGQRGHFPGFYPMRPFTREFVAQDKQEQEPVRSHGILSAQNNAVAGMDGFLSHLMFTPPPPSHPHWYVNLPLHQKVVVLLCGWPVVILIFG